MNYLDIVLDTTEDASMTLRELIAQTTDQPIENSYVIVGKDENDDPIINRFSAWTKDYILVLLTTANGYHLLKHERNFDST